MNIQEPMLLREVEKTLWIFLRWKRKSRNCISLGEGISDNIGTDTLKYILLRNSGDTEEEEGGWKG